MQALLLLVCMLLLLLLCIASGLLVGRRIVSPTAAI